MPRVSARALIVQDGKILLMFRRRMSLKSGGVIEYYSVPGGGIEPGETPEQAVVRELKEEMSVDLKLGELVGHHIESDFEHYIFTATVPDDAMPALRADSEEARHLGRYNWYEPMWVDVDQLQANDLLYYAPYYPLIKDLAAGTGPKVAQSL